MKIDAIAGISNHISPSRIYNRRKLNSSHKNGGSSRIINLDRNDLNEIIHELRIYDVYFENKRTNEKGATGEFIDFKA